MIEQGGLSQKNAAAASNALSMAKYVYNYYPGMPEGAKAVLHHLKLDIVSCCNFSWIEAHNALRHSVALDNLKNTLPLIDEDQRLALLHAPLKGTTLFGGETPRSEHKASCDIYCVPYANSAPFSYSSDRRGSRRSSGRGRGQDRSMPSTTITKPGQSKEGQTTMTVSVPQDSNKRKVEPRDDASQTPRKNKHSFSKEKSR